MWLAITTPTPTLSHTQCRGEDDDLGPPPDDSDFWNQTYNINGKPGGCFALFEVRRGVLCFMLRTRRSGAERDGMS